MLSKALRKSKKTEQTSLPSSDVLSQLWVMRQRAEVVDLRDMKPHAIVAGLYLAHGWPNIGQFIRTGIFIVEQQL